MADENPDGGGPSTVSQDYRLAARIAQKLRQTGLKAQILNPVPADTAVLRRDRVVVVLALTFLTVLAWSYLLWLSADMNMGGMDMTGLRMIPSGMGLMMPTDMPWRAMEFAFVFAMWTVMMVGMLRCFLCMPAWAGRPSRTASRSGQPSGSRLAISWSG